MSEISENLEERIDIDKDIREKKGEAVIETYNGNLFNLFDNDRTKLDDIDIDDIAHGLSMNCRYNGHVKHFYSVAEHAVLVSYLVDPEYAFDALHHDDSEAYISDMPRPFKQFIRNYEEIEHNVQERIAAKFGFNHPEPEQVKLADRAILWIEAQKLVYSKGAKWNNAIYDVYKEFVVDQGRKLPFDGQCVWGLRPEHAKDLFLERHNEILSLGE